jgi:hypothetical protein
MVSKNRYLSVPNFAAELCTTGITFIKGIFNYNSRKYFVFAELDLIAQLKVPSDPSESRAAVCMHDKSLVLILRRLENLNGFSDVIIF